MYLFSITILWLRRSDVLVVHKYGTKLFVTILYPSSVTLDVTSYYIGES